MIVEFDLSMIMSLTYEFSLEFDNQPKVDSYQLQKRKTPKDIKKNEGTMLYGN